MDRKPERTTRVVTITFTGTDEAFDALVAWAEQSDLDLTTAEACATLVRGSLGESVIVSEACAPLDITYTVDPPKPTP